MNISLLRLCSRLQLAALTSATCLLVLASGQLHAADSKHIFKWVDEKGVTHYGDSIPPQYADRAKSEINSKGLAVKPSQNTKPKDEKTSKVMTEQERSDRALLAAYTTEQEIDAARDRNLQSSKLLVDSLQQRKESAQARLDARKKTMDDIIKRKKPVPDDLTQEHKENLAEIARIDDQITQQNTGMEATRKRFDNDKRRYLELKSAENKPQEAANPSAPNLSPAPAKH